MDLHQKFTLVAHNPTPLVIQNTHQHYAVASVCMCVCISLYLCVCVCVIFVLSYLSSPAFFPIFHVCCPFSHPYTAPAIPNSSSAPSILRLLFLLYSHLLPLSPCFLPLPWHEQSHHRPIRQLCFLTNAHPFVASSMEDQDV